jgi:hypothetical protein
MKRKITELVTATLLILSLFSLCAEYKTITAEIIGVSITITGFMVSAVLINRYYRDGRWQ